jgi:hypothetical protein
VPMSELVVAGVVYNVLSVTYAGRPGRVKSVSLRCPTCDGSIDLTPTQLAGVEPHACDCGYSRRVDFTEAL